MAIFAIAFTFIFIGLCAEKISLVHIELGLLLSLIGLSVLWFSKHCKIEVSQAEIIIHHALKKERRIAICEIEKIVIGYKLEIIGYDKNRKVITIDRSTLNTEQFKNQLEKLGVKFEYKA